MLAEQARDAMALKVREVNTIIRNLSTQLESMQKQVADRHSAQAHRAAMAERACQSAREDAATTRAAHQVARQYLMDAYDRIQAATEGRIKASESERRSYDMLIETLRSDLVEARQESAENRARTRAEKESLLTAKSRIRELELSNARLQARLAQPAIKDR
ncbi:hypothetical protein [Nonomuraea aurantiaca]|uniref:hypothetical protein n=1 Tax=Nonomuraea aurantiaca TaxID=2878562 RepID=UPI001CD9F8F8|nr:hypothetical protein [Nonomuraea aurantiaca]MCA2230427.1 hypothetical protein [Nonomuraea aurantiaca]